VAKHHARAEFKLWLHIIDPKTNVLKIAFDDVVSISATFALNAVPAATVAVATGKNMQNKPATIHEEIKQLKPRDKAVVLLKVVSDDPDLKKLADASAAERVVIFEGYYMGLGYQRSYNSANYTLQLVHWLDDLNCSSMLNGNWHPGVPRDLAQAANNDVLMMRGGSNYAQIKPVVDVEHKVLNAYNISHDLWGLALKPIFEEITTLSHPKEQDASRQAADEEDKNGNNAAAKAALSRIPGDAPKPAKLPMYLGALEADLVNNAANEGISSIAGSNWAYSSFWSKMIGEFGPEFLFAISPGVTFANVIPFFSGLRDEWKIIKGSDYGYANFNVSVQHLIESIEIRYPQPSTSNIWTSGEGAASISYYYPWGRYPATNDVFRGQIVIKDPPVWLSNAVPNGLYSPGTTGIGGDSQPGDTAATPGDAPAAPSGGAPAPAAAERQFKDANILDRYAEHWYKSEVLAQRYGELSGKLRFDIAPGSIVQVEAPDTSIGDENVKMYAAVVSASYVIDAEKPAAGTSFTLISLRTETENNDADLKLTSKEPPLYPEGTWSGGPLVKEAI
jgi:hypothetical protein